MQGNRALGIGLVVGGAVLGGIMLAWQVVTLVSGELSGGGFVLGLLLAAILALPLIGGGLYVLSRSKLEEAAAGEFRAQRRTLESDRLFRAEQARELGQIARRLEASGTAESAGPAARLRDLVQDLEHPSYDSAAWYEAVELGRADEAALQRYDDLLTAGVRAMSELAGRLEGGEAVGAELGQVIQAWERDNNRRSDLLRGRRAPAVAPTDVLGAAAQAGTSESVTALKVGDAISRDGEDYLIETSVSYFAGGRTTWLHRLAAEREEAWLYVAPGGLSLAWLTVVEDAIPAGDATVVHEGASCSMESSGMAAAEVRSRVGQPSGGAVTTWRYGCDDGRMLWLERWPDGTRVYSGRPIRASDIDIWPSASPDARDSTS